MMMGAVWASQRGSLGLSWVLTLHRHAQDVLHRNKTQNDVASTLAGKVAELNLGQYDPELLKLAVRHAVNPAEAASYLREIQVRLQTHDGQSGLLLPFVLIPSDPGKSR